MNTRDRCPRCEGRIRSWSELDEEERQVVRRMPSDYSLEERQARHRWCTRCWFEETSGSPTMV